MTSYRTPDGVIVPTEDVVYQNGTNRPMWFDGHRNVLLTEEDDSTTNKSLVPRMPFAVPNRRTSYTAQQLMDADFPEPKWAVPGLIAEGLTFIAGAPKVGKSWLALGLGIAVASGGQVLGNIPVDVHGWGTDLAAFTAEDLARIAASLNNRPRKTLGFMKPSERLAALLR